MCYEKTPWEKSVEFHGHTCPGLAIGFRAAELALEEMGSNRSSDEELAAIVENNSCGVDAVQAFTGCSFGKGNLFFHDYGKQVYTFFNRKNGSAVRVAVRHGSFHNPEFQALRDKVKCVEATEQDREAFRKAMDERVQQILKAGTDAFHVKQVTIDAPPAASIYPTVQCSRCGEGVMEPRARLKGGSVVCIPCYETAAE